MADSTKSIADSNSNTTLLNLEDFAGDPLMITINQAHMTGHLNKLLKLINDENATLDDIRHQAWCYKISEEMLLTLITHAPD